MRSLWSCTATRRFGDDRAIRTGWAKLDAYRVLVVGHQKGKNLKERNLCNYGYAHPEGYRKAMAKMRLAAKFHMPVICLIDTGGAYPGIGAEERGQAQVIAESMFEMSRLPTPMICVVIGEGGSGGALGIGVGDRVAMLEHAYYSVISPEGFAGILWKSHTFKEKAAEALKMTSKDLSRLGSDRRGHLRTPRRRPSRSPLDGQPTEALSSRHAPRVARQADRSTSRRALSEVPPHGSVSRRRPAEGTAVAPAASLISSALVPSSCSRGRRRSQK